VRRKMSTADPEQRAQFARSGSGCAAPESGNFFQPDADQCQSRETRRLYWAMAFMPVQTPRRPSQVPRRTRYQAWAFSTMMTESGWPSAARAYALPQQPGKPRAIVGQGCRCPPDAGVEILPARDSTSGGGPSRRPPPFRGQKNPVAGGNLCDHEHAGGHPVPTRERTGQNGAGISSPSLRPTRLPATNPVRTHAQEARRHPVQEGKRSWPDATPPT